MSYCPECCSEDVDGIKRGNKRHFICSVCGAEWVELDNYGRPAAGEAHQCTENPQLTQMYKRKK
ncbi:MAG: hypothetical protein ABSF36_02570 [Candidatus Methanomethylicaceae archaeon]|jgi:transposase-like protein